jgi:hypothetical protein
MITSFLMMKSFVCCSHRLVGTEDYHLQRLEYCDDSPILRRPECSRIAPTTTALTPFPREATQAVLAAAEAEWPTHTLTSSTRELKSLMWSVSTIHSVRNYE